MLDCSFWAVEKKWILETIVKLIDDDSEFFNLKFEMNILKWMMIIIIKENELINNLYIWFNNEI